VSVRPKNNDQPSGRGLQLPLSERRLLLGAGDWFAVNAAVLIALRVWAIVGQREFALPFIVSQAHWFVILSALWLTLAAANNFYDLALTARWLQSQARLLEITLQLLVVYLLIFFLSPREALPRLFILYYAGASYILIALWRLSRPFLTGWAPSRRRALVVGVGWPAQTIIEAIQRHAPDDYEVVGVVDEAAPLHPDEIVIEAEVIGSGADLARIAQELRAGEIILATSDNVDGALFQAIMDCYELGIPVTPMPLLYEQLARMVPVRYVRGHWNVVLPLEGRSPFNPYPLLKRLMDLTLGVVGLVIFGAMLPLLALLIVLDSPGPVFFAQERVGRAGRPFKLVKLRTMIPDAERESGPLWAVHGDPRVTRVGRFLRMSRLDEAPQLINVLAGQMSLIGPRPERPAFVADLQAGIPFYRARLSVRPGVTGWAQVNYGYGSTVEDQIAKLQYDLYYIRHRSLLLDTLILLRTVGQVLALRGT
jgi:exopolysaccharide biosynthesis polyprenyl glycosylphosphotransferase